MSRVLVVQMHGEPGSGKSTLARALGRELHAVVLDKDVLKSALLAAGLDEGRAAPAAYEVYFAMARSLVSQRWSVVLDNPVFWPRVEARWRELSARAGSPEILIACVCADRRELARRLAEREAMASQPREPLDLERHAGAVATAFEPRLTIETAALTLEEQLTRALAYIRALVESPASDGRRAVPSTP